MAKKIGFIGMGTMGSRMATRLLAAKHNVTVFNRDKSKTKPVVELGATVADTIPELVEKADYVCTSVYDDEAIKEVIIEALQAHCKGKIFISFSTISPDTAEELAGSINKVQAYFLD